MDAALHFVLNFQQFAKERKFQLNFKEFKKEPFDLKLKSYV